MKAIDCIKLASAYVSDSKLETILEKIEEGETLSTTEEKKLKRYINGLNIAVDSIITDYFPMKSVKLVVTDKEGKISYDDIDSRVSEILEIKDAEKGGAVEFYSLPFYLYSSAKNSKVYVNFKYLPEEVKDVLDDVAVFPYITRNLISYLMASDIMLSMNSFDEARFWKEKYEGEAMKILRGLKIKSIPVRRIV